MNKNILAFLLLFFCIKSLLAQEVISVGGGGFPYEHKKGFVYGILEDQETKEAVIGAIVINLDEGDRTVSDINGKFRLRVPLGITTISIQSVGYNTSSYKLNVSGEGTYNIYLESALTELDAVVISGNKADANIKSTDLGKSSLSIDAIKQLPMSMGEIDIIKSLTLLPGVSTNSELSTGFNVRGGGADQNLVLLGDVPIYNPAHLFGFYSAFNAEVIDDVTLYKGGVPAMYGGRASSVLHVKYRDGDYHQWKGKLSAGVASSKLTVEGPVLKDKLSILGSVRRSYINYMLKAFKEPTVNRSSADFYDVNAIINYRLNDRNKLTYAVYKSADNFNLAGDTSYQWTNFYQSVNWYHHFSDQLSLKATGALSNYNNEIENQSVVNPYHIQSQVHNDIANIDLEYTPGEQLTLRAGVNYTGTRLQPGHMIPEDPEDNVYQDTRVQKERSRELAFFIDGSYDLNPKFSISAGLRYNTYNYLGEHTIYQYEAYRPKTETNITNAIHYDDGESIQTYSGWEPRLALRYSIDPNSSIKLGYNRMYQYILLVSNTTTIAPNDIWKLSDNYLNPQIADQVSLGYYKNFNKNEYETSIEGFYKETQNIVDYKDGADLFLNNHIETELLSGKGLAYGAELYLKKKSGGRLKGWVSYTFSRSLRKVQDPYDAIRNGNWYPSNFDRKHNFTNVLIYQLSKQWEFSSTFTFKSGQPVTYPTSRISYNNQELPIFSDRNNERSPVYHRLDISFTKKFKFLKKSQGEFNFSVYNLYARKNPFSVFFQDAPGSPPQPYQLSILGVPFPSMSFTFNI